MKPAVFEFVRATSIAEASQMLAQLRDARIVAGAQSLGPMLNLRLAEPRILIDITGIKELTRIADDGEAVTIGACVTTANIEDGRIPGRGLEILVSVATQIAYRAVRNRGTIGGSLCHADPAADWVSLLGALNAECIIADSNGRRRLCADEFVTGAYENALGATELLEAIRVPRLSPRGRCGYYKISRKVGEFALAIGAVLIDPDRGLSRAVLGAGQGRPIVFADMSELRRPDGTLDESALSRALDRNGITDRIDRRQKFAAFKRAYDQAAA
jgi:carbon-monoxide dehydrogenase medium subunit